MYWLSLFKNKTVNEGFLTSFNLWFMLTIVIKAFYANFGVDIKPIFLNKRYLFQNKQSWFFSALSA